MPKRCRKAASTVGALRRRSEWAPTQSEAKALNISHNPQRSECGLKPVLCLESWSPFPIQTARGVGLVSVFLWALWPWWAAGAQSPASSSCTSRQIAVRIPSEKSVVKSLQPHRWKVRKQQKEVTHLQWATLSISVDYILALETQWFCTATALDRARFWPGSALCWAHLKSLHSCWWEKGKMRVW